MNKQGSGAMNFIAGLLIGAVAGAIAGVLLAPSKGTETRRKIISEADEFTDSLHDRIDALKATIEQKMDEIRSSLKKEKA